MKRIVYHSSEIYFSSFDNKYIKELGFHFGSKSQAYNNIVNIINKNDIDYNLICYLYKCEIDIRNTYTMTLDCWNWSYEMISIFLDPNKNKYSNLFSVEEWANIHNVDDLVKEFKRKEYNSIEYFNNFEGSINEKSYILFDSEDIKIIEIYKCIVTGRFLEVTKIDETI
jgi:hypothetical protein